MEIIPVTAKLKYFSNIKLLILNIYFLIIHQLEKNSFESDFSYIISLCLYFYTCGVNSGIRFLELYINNYLYSYRSWCERAIKLLISFIKT